MKKFISKAKSSFKELQDSALSTQSPLQEHTNIPSTLGIPTQIDVIRYRHHHGTNLGTPP